ELRQRVGEMRPEVVRTHRNRWRKREYVRISTIFEVRQTLSAAQEGSARVDAVHEVEALHRRLLGAGEGDRAGVVDQNIDARERIDCCRDCAGYLLLVPDVAFESKRVSSSLSDLFAGGIKRTGEV